MTKPMLLGISGSLRKDSTNRKLLREAAQLFGDCTFLEAEVKFPIYDGDDEDADGVPAAVQKLSDQIAEADAVIISTPEYNKGPSGALKNALDWVSRTKPNPWAGKPARRDERVVRPCRGRTGADDSARLHGSVPAAHPAGTRSAPGRILEGIRR